MRRFLKVLFYLIASVVLIVALGVGYFSYERSKRETATNQQAAPGGGSFVSIDGLNMYYQEVGSKTGQCVILLHGTGAWSEIWKETMNMLAGNNFRAIAVDIPPFGFSDKPEGVSEYSTLKQADRINKLIKNLELDSVILVAHSVGSRAGLQAVFNKNSKIKQLVLVDPALSFSPDSVQVSFEHNDPSFALRTFFSFPALRNAGIAAFGTNPGYSKKSFQSFVSKKESVTDEKVAIINKPLSVQGITKGYGYWLQNLLCENTVCDISDIGNLKNIHIPVVLIWGAQDAITPLWQGKALLQYFPDSRLAVINDAGHIPYIESADSFNNILLTSISY